MQWFVTETFETLTIENQPCLTIGITGGIGSGKSVVSRVLRCNGYYVYDCDTEAKRLMTRNIEVRNILIDTLGSHIYTEDGFLNRRYLSKLLFEKKDARDIVNGIVHKAVREDIEAKRKMINGYMFVESAILATGRLDKYCNKIWIVESDQEVKVRRIKQRDGLTEEEILNRMKIQAKELDLLPQDKSIIIKNDNENSIILKIRSLLKTI